MRAAGPWAGAPGVRDASHVYISIASFGLSAFTNSFSASSNRPSSSRNIANLRCTSGNFSFLEADARLNAWSKAPDSVA